MKYRTILYILIVITVFLIIGIFVLLQIANQKSVNKLDNNKSTNTNINNSPVSSPISQANNAPSLKTYKSTDSKYKYTYPSNWTFRKGREGIGLYPLNEALYSSGNIEIITIFAIESLDTAEEFSKKYDGFGQNYSEGQNTKINGYEVYKFTYESSYKQLFYVFAHKGLIIHISFREKDSSRGENIDNSKYIKDVESIVNSIEFLN